MYWKIIKSHMTSPVMKGSESKVRLDERVAAVTGANTGIGFETAQGHNSMRKSILIFDIPLGAIQKGCPH